MVVTPTPKTLNRCARHRIPNFRPPPLIRACRIVAHLSCQKGMATPLAVPPCGGSAEGHAAVEDNVKETVDTHEFPDVEQSGSHATTATTAYSSVQTDTILNSFLEVPYARSVQAVPQHSLPRSKHTAAWRRCVLLSLRGVCQPSFLSDPPLPPSQHVHLPSCRPYILNAFQACQCVPGSLHLTTSMLSSNTPDT